jgi:2,3-bisphosphoglycerate-dependent phosphoglycerate mutase
MSKLVLIRHGQSLWNAENKFTGWVDVPLSERGRAEAMIAACKLNDEKINFDVCFTSLLIRTQETAIICLTECESVRGGKVPIMQHTADDPNWHGWNNYNGKKEEELPIFPSQALDERYYGELQGLNKAETVAKFGQEQVKLWRRSYDVRPPGGESLEDTKNRVIPFFKSRILTHLKEGDDVLVSAHGNSLRAMIMELEQLTPEEVTQVEFITGVPIVYDLDAEGKVLSKKILNS